ncbi:MAG: hypothetical protein JNK27_14815 [Chitinophagaceae bacterium]|nr:hypothetical protein [Chitinophagaceae bacterium]
MEVQDSVSFNEHPGYSIEWGYATWSRDEEPENKDWSIRNRYTNESGRFNYAGSSEVPWEDFKRMIVESIKRGQFDQQELAEILSEIATSLSREG